ncbi:preprotein translocase subunit YajC [Fructobacillus ficulneus]|uniref:Preprotein translocase subunit YajC n=1 Tax=Fructobacillus ficulneus TaxID=157463 RepID=A0A0K8MHA6_9LACO|nr:preprotein translocase subunit YajC [Fructobacillus ficulneus]GAO99548.1 hypothetical protein FFIC_230320 [Fructobacillus ficulneus]
MQSIILPLAVIALMLFWMSRTSKKQKQRQEEMRTNLKKGAKVITIGGMHAVVESVDNEAKTVDLNAEGVILTFEANALRKIEAETPAATQAPVEKTEEVEEVEKAEETKD